MEIFNGPPECRLCEEDETPSHIIYDCIARTHRMSRPIRPDGGNMILVGQEENNA